MDGRTDEGVPRGPRGPKNRREIEEGGGTCRYWKLAGRGRGGGPGGGGGPRGGTCSYWKLAGRGRGPGPRFTNARFTNILLLLKGAHICFICVNIHYGLSILVDMCQVPQVAYM